MEKRALSNEALLRGTSYVFNNAGDISSSEARTEEAAELLRIFKQPSDSTVKEITFFDGNLC